MKKCDVCNIECSDDMNFCSKCGKELSLNDTIKTEDKKNKKGKKKILRYIIGIFFILTNISDFPALHSIFGVLFGISLIPNIYKKIKININKKAIKIIISIVLLFLWVTFLPAAPLEYISINNTENTVGIGTNYEIDFSTNLSSIEKNKFTYKSSNENIATVENGIIKGLSEGTVTIEIIGENNISSSAEFIVKYIKLEKIEVKGDTKLLVGESGSLEAFLTPENTSDKKITWKSDNPDIISVNNNGELKAISKGKAKITVTSEKGVSTTIDVGSYIAIESLEISPKEMTIEKGKTGKLKLNINPSDADSNGIIWSSSDNNIATVENGLITAKGNGEVKITAKSVNGKTAYANITVNEIYAESIELNKDTLSLAAGKTSKITGNISPKNTSDKTITWSSSNSEVATVSDGKVTAKSRGNAVITATTSNGKTATLIVSVTEKAPVTISRFRWTRDSAGGVEWSFSLKNNSSKTINYVILTWNNYNAVGDPAYDQITGKSAYQLYYTGPIKPGKKVSNIVNTRLFYSWNYKSSLISEVIIMYADGTEQVISGNDLRTYKDLIIN